MSEPDQLSRDRIRQTVLRKELKEWERTFAADHDGRKATRDEIKANYEIAAKYREYNNLRNVTSGRPGKKSSRIETDSKRDPQTPSRKRKRNDDGPQQRKLQQEEHLADHQPEVGAEEARTPPRQYVDPTPQRDGRVLGLFDLIEGTPSTNRSLRRAPGQRNLKDSAGVDETPSHRKGERRMPLGEQSVNSAAPSVGWSKGEQEQDQPNLATPSKSTASELLRKTLHEVTPSSPRRHARTPPSTGRRFMLNHVLTTSTPSLFSSARKRKRDIYDSDNIKTTETPRLKDGRDQEQATIGPEFTTPAFLRTRPMTATTAGWGTQLDTIVEEAEDDALQGTPSKRARTLKRSNTAPAPLGIRALGRRKPFVRTLSQLLKDAKKTEDGELDEEQVISNQAETLGEPTSAVHMNHGHEVTVKGTEDGGSAYRKKKGAKRQTKKAILKPKPPISKTPSFDDEGPVMNAPLVSDRAKLGQERHLGWNAEEPQEGTREGKEDPHDQSNSRKRKNAEKEETEEAQVSLKKRKLNPLAHTNFKKLKIRGKGMKPKNWRKR